MSKGIQFKVWQSEHRSAAGKPGGFFAHMISGNNKVVWASTPSNEGDKPGFDDVRSAFKTCQHTWDNVGKAMGMDPAATNFPPCPYTKDSLKPKPKKVAA